MQNSHETLEIKFKILALTGKKETGNYIMIRTKEISLDLMNRLI